MDGSIASENVILMVGWSLIPVAPSAGDEGSEELAVGGTVSEFVTLSSFIVELSMLELSTVELSIVEFVIVQLLNVELEIVELSILHETILEHCLTVELSMYELLVIDELSETVEELLIVELSNV